VVETTRPANAGSNASAIADASYASLMAIRPELRDELLKLPADERQELANELYESLDDEPVDPTWELAWSDEITGRVQEVADGTVRLVDADEMHAALRSELQPAGK
jgi:putative addiction module component (TIGR02574 family)